MTDNHLDRRRADYVTVGEFGRTMTLLEEIRTDLKNGQAGLRVDMLAGIQRITDRQDVANGRVMAAEKDIAETAHELEGFRAKALAYRDSREVKEASGRAVIQAIKTEVDQLLSEGCRVRQQHVVEVQALAAAGVIDVPNRNKWAGYAPKAAIGIGGLGLGVLMPHLVDLAHWLLSLLPAMK